MRGHGVVVSPRGQHAQQVAHARFGQRDVLAEHVAAFAAAAADGVECVRALAGAVGQQHRIARLVERVARGQETKAEALGFQDVSLARYCNFA